MDDKYVTLAGEGMGSLVEKKSEFIGYAAHVTTKEQADDFIAKIRKKHADARHNTYAYVLKEGNYMRYSDDGEPQGTAGMPILDVIRKSGFTDAVIVVTRYFGGILLGTGGLVRAYTAAAKLAAQDARIVQFIPYTKIFFSVDYSLWQKVKNEIEKMGFSPDNVDYAAEVEVQISFPDKLVDGFAAKLTEMSAGRSEVIEIEKCYGEGITF